MDVAGIVAVRVQADLKPLDQGFAEAKRKSEDFDRGASRAIDGVGRSARRAGDEVQGMARRAAAANDNVRGSASRLALAYDQVRTSVMGVVRGYAAMAAATFGIAAIGRTLGGFEQSMAAVAAITRASTSELAAMRDIARDLGATTEFTASQAADGLKFLGMAGFNAAQSIAAIPDVLNLATAAQMDLARAADISSNIMSAFGISADNAGAVADVLAASASRANTDVYQLGDAMKYAGPVASALGISMADAAAAIGTLSDAGIQGSMAGTGLRQVLSGLANVTPQAAKVIRSLGLTVEELNPATNRLVDVIGKLRQSGMNAADALTIFGDRGGPAILALTELEPKLRQLTTTLGGVEGEASRMAETMRDNLAGDFNGMLSAIESVVIALGDAGLTAALRAVAQGFTIAFRTAASVVATLGDMLPVIAVGMAVAFGPAVLSAIAFGFGYIGAAGVAAIRAITVAMAANPIGALAIGISIAITAIYHFRDAISEALGVDVVQIAKDSANLVIGSFVAAFENIKFVWNNFGTVLGAAAIGAVNAAIRAINGLIDAAIEGINWLIDAANEVPGVNIGRVSGGLIPEMDNPYAGAIQGHLNNLRDILSQDYLGTLSEVATGTTSVAEATAKLNEILKRSATSLGDTDKAAAKAAKAYDDIVRGAREFIAANELEQQVIGMTQREANRLRYEQDLLNQAQRAGIQLTDEQRAELAGLAAQMADTQERAGALQAAFDFARDLVGGFVADLRAGLEQGKSFWQSFGEAALNVLDRIVDKLLNSVLDALFQVSGAGGGVGGVIGTILGSLFGFARGGVFSGGNVIPFARGGVVSRPTVFPMARGAGLMGEAGPEAIMPLRRDSSGRLGVIVANENRQGGDAGGQVINFAPVTNIDARGASPGTAAALRQELDKRDRALLKQVQGVVSVGMRRGDIR